MVDKLTPRHRPPGRPRKAETHERLWPMVPHSVASALRHMADKRRHDLSTYCCIALEEHLDREMPDWRERFGIR